MEDDMPWTTTPDSPTGTWIATHFAKPGVRRSTCTLYDFGDGWSHKVELVALLRPH
jgi:hypothetical protein